MYVKNHGGGIVVILGACVGEVTSSTPQLANKLLHDLWEGTWQPPGLPHANLSLVHPKCHRPIVCRKMSKSDWATYGNIPWNILFLLTGLYGCLVSIPVKLYPKFACLTKWTVGSNFLIRTLFWVKRVALELYHWDKLGCSGFD